jgi:hypothetical protein
LITATGSPAAEKTGAAAKTIAVKPASIPYFIPRMESPYRGAERSPARRLSIYPFGFKL